MKLLVIGHARHGKDTFAEYLRDRHGWSFASSGEFACEKAVYPLMTEFYPDWRSLYRDKEQYRELFFHAIRAYNLRPGPALHQQILSGHDMYLGMRSRAEFTKSVSDFDLVVWIDASQRKPMEPLASNELTPADADVIINNNSTLEDLHSEIEGFLTWLENTP